MVWQLAYQKDTYCQQRTDSNFCRNKIYCFCISQSDEWKRTTEFEENLVSISMGIQPGYKVGEKKKTGIPGIVRIADWEQSGFMKTQAGQTIMVGGFQ